MKEWPQNGVALFSYLRSKTMAINLIGDKTPQQIEQMMRTDPSGRSIVSTKEEMKEKVYPTTAKERVEQELDELNEKMVKLTSFLYGRKIVEGVVTAEMRALMGKQLKHMQEYAETLQDRLMIWDLHKN